MDSYDKVQVSTELVAGGVILALAGGKAEIVADQFGVNVLFGGIDQGIGTYVALATFCFLFILMVFLSLFRHFTIAQSQS